jgi:hypothetical protein
MAKEITYCISALTPPAGAHPGTIVRRLWMRQHGPVGWRVKDFFCAPSSAGTNINVEATLQPTPDIPVTLNYGNGGYAWFIEDAIGGVGATRTAIDPQRIITGDCYIIAAFPSGLNVKLNLFATFEKVRFSERAFVAAVLSDIQASQNRNI